MTEQKAKFGVLVQRGKEQYVIEGGEHPVPPEIAPTPPMPGWYCTRDDGYGYIHIWCALANTEAGGGCAGRFYNLCERGEKGNSLAYIVNLGIVPKDEESIKIKLGKWELDYTYDGGLDNVYASPGYFEYLVKVNGDVDKFKYYRDFTGASELTANEPFKTYVWDDYAWVEFDPSNVEAGNYTIHVQIRFRPTPFCCNCTFTKLLPFWAADWPIHVTCIDRMLEPYKSFDFGTIRIYETKEANFTIKNNINTTLLTDVWIDGPDALDFDIIEGPKGKFYLWPNNYTNIKIKWNPQVLGNQTAKLNISCDNGYWDYCYLLGFSESPPCEFLHIHPPSGGDDEYSFGEVLVGQSQTAAFKVFNVYSDDLYVNIKLEGDSDFRLLSDGGVEKISAYFARFPVVEFAPTSPGEKVAYLKLEPCNNSLLIKGVGKSAIIFDPWAYDFGAEKIGSCSDTVVFNIKNIGEEDAEVSVSIQGDQSKNFELVEGFNDTLYAGYQETVRVRFCPLEEGDIKAYLCAEVKADGSDYINITANLCGKGCLRYVTPYIEIVGAETIDFPNTYVGCSAEKYSAVKNVGCTDASFKLKISGDDCFSINLANTTITLKPGLTFLYKVKFEPTESGNFTANILIEGLNCNDVEVVAHGTAISIGDVLKIEPSSYDFDVGVSNWKCSDSKNFTIYNSGNEAINFTLSIKGEDASDFVILEGEGDQSLPPGSYINAEVQFCPKGSGGRKEAFLTIEPYSPKTENVSAKITGLALVPCQFELSPTKYDFGSHLISTCSNEVSFTLTQKAGSPTSVSIRLEGDSEHFQITQQPPNPFPWLGSDIIKVKYCPKTAGNHTAYLVITPDICKGISATLIGQGEESPPTAPKFEISPTSFNFGQILENSCSEAQNFTVRNVGDAVGYISANITGTHASNFKIVSQVGSNKIPPGGWHSFAIKFCPNSVGDFYGKLWINTGWEYGEIPDVYADLYGVGRFGFEAEFSPSVLDFGTILKDECSSEKTIYLYNTGTRNMTVKISVGDPKNFTITEGGGYHYLETNQTHTIKVKFCPSEVGNITSYIAAWPHILEDEVPSMTIHGVGQARCSIDISPSSYDFGSMYIGDPRKYSEFRIKNQGEGDAVLNLTVMGVNAQDFVINGDTSGIKLPSESEISIKVGFAPTATGDRQAFLIVLPDTCAYEWALLKGEGLEKPLCMLKASPTNIDFGSIPIHSRSPNITVTIINQDSVETDVYEISLCGENPEEFSAPTEAPGVVPGLSSIEIPIQFCPSTVGKKSAWLCIKSDNCTVGAGVFLQGEGIKLEGNPSWDPDPPEKNPVSSRWYALGAVKPSQSPGYGIVVGHCPKSKWLAFPPENPVYIFYLDHKGCLWMRDVAGKLWIYNLYTRKYTYYDIGSGSPPVFALGETKESGDRIEFVYWQEPNFIVFAEAAWENEMWSELQLITSYTVDDYDPNMIYWYPPYYLFLNRASNNRLALWNANEGLVQSVSLDWSPQYATRDKDGRIWISSENSNILANFDENLEDMEIQTFSASRKFAGLNVNSHGDVAAVDVANKEVIILLAEEDYSKIYNIGATNIQPMVGRWEGGYCLFTAADIPFLAVHLEDFAKGSFTRGRVFGGEVNNLVLRGDAGLLSYSTWKWSWKPDTKAIETFLGE